jgi:hypothetical protein
MFLRFSRVCAKMFIFEDNKFVGYFTWLFCERHQRLDCLMVEIYQRAEKKKLKFEKPKIRIIKKKLGKITSYADKQVGAKTSLDGKFIIIAPEYVASLDDSELQILLAHKFGHALKAQMGQNTDHLFFKYLTSKALNPEDFGNAIAAYLFSSEAVISVSKKLNLSLSETTVRLLINMPGF